jgi:Flp pilus assembly pilin Flp
VNYNMTHTFMLKPVVALQTWVAEARTRQEGQTMAEYSIVLGVITLGVIALFITLGGQIAAALGKVVTALGLSPATK